MDEKQVRAKLGQVFQQINSNTPVFHGDIVSRANAAYELKHKRPMTANTKAVLQNSLNQITQQMIQQGKSMQQIQSAAEDPTAVDNPISMLFNLVSILVPNYAYSEVVGVQPMPSDPSPIFYPQLVANESRNGVAAGTVLLGSTNWNTNMHFTTNKISQSVDTASGSLSLALTKAPIAGKLRVVLHVTSVGDIVLFGNDSNTGFTNTSEFSDYVDTATITESSGTYTVAIAMQSGVTATMDVTYSYVLTDKPAQARFEFATKSVSADPYRIRSTYSLENFYAAKQVLADYNIDEAMATSVAGYINAEISQNIFDEIKDGADATYTWTKAAPTGVSWALHRLSVLQVLVNTSNGIRKNVKRSGGNKLIASTDLISVIETLGSDLWVPEKYAAEPVGPYLAGKLAGKFDVLKNQEYPDATSVMTFKSSDIDAANMVGVFIGLFNTNPLFLDDLNAVSGFGARLGYTKVFENSIAKIEVI